MASKKKAGHQQAPFSPCALHGTSWLWLTLIQIASTRVCRRSRASLRVLALPPWALPLMIAGTLIGESQRSAGELTPSPISPCARRIPLRRLRFEVGGFCLMARFYGSLLRLAASRVSGRVLSPTHKAQWVTKGTSPLKAWSHYQFETYEWVSREKPRRVGTRLFFCPLDRCWVASADATAIPAPAGPGG